MKKTVRYYGAVAIARLSRMVLKATGRKGTHFPGEIALKIDPQILGSLARPKKLIVVTGTNGKTTVSNMLIDFFKSQNIETVNNNYGSNILQGNVSALLAGSNFWSTESKEWGILEVDELSCEKVCAALKPDYIVVTNLFRDSYRRNAHVDFIFEKLLKSIPKESHLILNADDLISSRLKTTQEKTTFGIDRLPLEEENRQCLINDLVVCPNCYHPLTFDFQRYHHLGKVHCEACGVHSLTTDYKVTNVVGDYATVLTGNHTYSIRIGHHNMTSLYNMIAVVTVLNVVGFSMDSIIKQFDSIKVVKSRFDEITVNNRRLIMMLAKDQNPVANTRVYDYIGHRKDVGNVGVLMMNQDNQHGELSENVAWLYDANFEFMLKPHIKRLGFGTHRYLDYCARCEMAGFDSNQLYGAISEQEIAMKFPLEGLDTVYLLYGTKDEKKVLEAKEILINRFKKM